MAQRNYIFKADKVMPIKMIKKFLAKRAAYRAFDQMGEVRLLDLGLCHEDVKNRTVTFS